jgi:predicted transglutaminase-like cysteine proteinase
MLIASAYGLAAEPIDDPRIRPVKEKPTSSAGSRIRLLPNPFGSISPPTFQLPQPLGTTVPNSPEDRLANREFPDSKADRESVRAVPSQTIGAAPATDPAEAPPPPASFAHRWKAEIEAEVTPAPSIAIGPPALAPLAYTRFCQTYPAECEERNIGFDQFAFTPGRWAELAAINNVVNRAITPIRDDVDAVAQDWRIHPRSGNCKDYAVTKRHDLLAQGWPSGSLLLSEVVLSTGEHHLVLVVPTTDGEYVLDNLNPFITRVENAPYRWIRIQSSSDPNLWVEFGHRIPWQDAHGQSPVSGALRS